MRVTTDLFVAVLLRRVQSDGGFATVLRRGSTEAGAVFVVVRGRDGLVTLYSPAPQASYEAERPDRAFTCRLTSVEEDAVTAVLDKEIRFDPDLWAVEVELARLAIDDLLTLTTP